MFVVCHMLSSLDGRIDGAFFSAPETAPAVAAYGNLRGYYHCQATLYGTTTMLGGYADGPAPALPETGAGAKSGQPFDDYVNPEGKALGNYIVSVDPLGSLGFQGPVLEKKGRPAAHVIQVLTSRVSPAYLAYLRDLGISWVIAGDQALDCALLLDKLEEKFSIQRLMVAGGGITNWSFLSQGLLDELSLVLAPAADGDCSAASTFARPDFLPARGPAGFSLLGAETVAPDVLWLRYRVKT